MQNEKKLKIKKLKIAYEHCWFSAAAKLIDANLSEAYLNDSVSPNFYRNHPSAIVGRMRATLRGLHCVHWGGNERTIAWNNRFGRLQQEYNKKSPQFTDSTADNESVRVAICRCCSADAYLWTSLYEVPKT